MNKDELVVLANNPSVFFRDIYIYEMQNKDSCYFRTLAEIHNEGAIDLLSIFYLGMSTDIHSNKYQMIAVISGSLPFMTLSLDEVNNLSNFVCTNNNINLIYIIGAIEIRIESGVDEPIDIRSYIESDFNKNHGLIIPLLNSMNRMRLSFTHETIMSFLNSKNSFAIEFTLLFLSSSNYTSKQLEDVLLNIFKKDNNKNIITPILTVFIRLYNGQIIDLSVIEGVLDEIEIRDPDGYIDKYLYTLWIKKLDSNSPVYKRIANEVASKVVINESNFSTFEGFIYSVLEDKNFDLISFLNAVCKIESNIDFLVKMSSVTYGFSTKELLLKKLIVFCFCDEEARLIRLLEYIQHHDVGEGNFELKDRSLDMLSIPPDDLVKIAWRMSGWFFFRKKIAFEFIFIIYRMVGENEKRIMENFVEKVFLNNFPGALFEYIQKLKSLNEVSGLTDFIENRLNILNSSDNGSFSISELRSSDYIQSEYEKYQNKWFKKVYEDARKKSIFSSMGSTIHVLYGKGTIFYSEQINEPPVRQETRMGKIEHSIENPLMLERDPIGLEMILLNCKYGDVK